MLQYQKIDVSEGIDGNKTSGSKECELFHYWFFENAGFKLEKHVCNGCHDLITTAYSLKNIAILNAKGTTFWCILMGVSKNEGLNRLNNSVTYDRRVLGIWILNRIVDMSFNPNKTPIEIIKEGAFGDTYFRNIYSGIDEK